MGFYVGYYSATSDPFAELVQSLRSSLLSPPVTSSASACPMAKPATYSGEASECSGFLLQCSLYSEMQPQQFVNERAKIAFIISLLSGWALQWARSIWDSQSPITRSLMHLKPILKKCLAPQLQRSPSITNSSDYGKRICPYTITP